MKKLFVFVSALMIGALVSNGAMATVPDLIPVQGVLADDAGAPIDGAIDLTFSLYDSETASTPLWTGTFADVDVAEGFFTVYLGSGAALDFSSLIGNTEIWLGMTVEADPEMDRMQLATVPFAIEAQVCQAVGSLTEADINANFAPTSHTHDGVYATDAHSHDWIDITTGMPAGFADGVDDVDDTVDWTEISGIAGTTSTTVAVGDHNHDADYSDIFHDHDADYADIAHEHDADYASVSHAHDWIDITTGVPAGFADGVDNDTTYTWATLPGIPADFADDVDNVDDTVSWTEISGIAGATATTVAVGNHNHDAVYATIAHTQDWSTITGAPAGFADGVDNVDDTVDWSEISGIVGATATSVAVGNHNHDANYAALSHNHDASYAPISHSHAWGTITSMPAGFADGVDNDTTYTWATLPGIPAGFADGVDNDTDTWLTYTGTAPVTVTGTVISLAADGIGAGLIATGGVATAEILDNTVLSADIADSTIASADIAADTITAADIATGGVASAEILDGSITYLDTNTASVQRRVTGTCPDGQPLSGINVDGTVTCSLGEASWSHYHNVYVTGSPISGAANYYLRMAAGAPFGRLETSLDGITWGTVCDDAANNAAPWAANLVCRAFGYTSGRWLFYDAVPDGSGSIFLDDWSCASTSNNLNQCTGTAWGTHNCSHSEDVGVYCIP